MVVPIQLVQGVSKTALFSTEAGKASVRLERTADEIPEPKKEDIVMLPLGIRVTPDHSGYQTCVTYQSAPQR